MEELVQIGKIVSDINRVKILGLMHRETELCVCEICDTLKLSQPLVSRHLKQMREAGIVKTKQSGKWMLYSLRESRIINCFLDTIQDEIKTLPTIITCTKE
ncbi:MULTISPECIES: metalloregulator ArsR/SmtB family transcription factor [Sulfurimonas]|uniref:ArsR/SmtB family transcription factor n=1 Tax=Sulfurimonas TaxID=202746 RepID=UPI0012644025|nr:metalloregulator ArsR/SmtB family transcription factor [Sulfurimonas indica]